VHIAVKFDETYPAVKGLCLSWFAIRCREGGDMVLNVRR